MQEFHQDPNMDRKTKLHLTYSKARELVAEVISDLPAKAETTIKNPGRMFNEEGEPLDVVAMVLTKANFDPAILKEDSYRGFWARRGNFCHFEHLGSYCFLFEDFAGAPNLATAIYLGRLATLMDQGWTVGAATKAAEAHTKKSYDKAPSLKGYTPEEQFGFYK